MPFDDTTLAEHDEPSFDAIRKQALSLAALCRAPLPAGDAGLIEAARRLAATNAAVMAMGYAGETGIRIEDEIIGPILNTAEDRLIEFLADQPPETLVGAAVKLRHAIAFDPEPGALQQILVCIEREIARRAAV